MSEFIEQDYNSYESEDEPVGISYFGGAKSDSSDSEKIDTDINNDNLPESDTDTSDSSNSDSSGSDSESDKISFDGNFSDSDEETKEELRETYGGMSDVGIDISEITSDAENNEPSGVFGGGKHKTGLNDDIMAQVTDLGGIIGGANILTQNNDDSPFIADVSDLEQAVADNSPKDETENINDESPYLDESNTPAESEEPETYIDESPIIEKTDTRLDDEPNSEMIDIGDSEEESDENNKIKAGGGRNNNIDESALSEALKEFLGKVETLH